jgi:hypothetical protein
MRHRIPRLSIPVVAAVAAVTAPSALDERVALAAGPTPAECLTASEASFALGGQHKLRAARSQLLVCAASTCPADVRQECLRRIDATNAQIPTIVFAAKDVSGADLTAVRVTMDGELVADRLEGTAISVDPGEHTFTFEAPDHSVVTRKLVILEGQKDRREAIALGTAPTSASRDRAEAASEPPSRERGAGMGTQRVLALIAGGLGVVGLGIGTAFGVMALSEKTDANSVCPNQCTSQDGVNKWNDATSKGNVSTIAFVAGGAGVVAAAVLWFTASSTGGSRTQVGFGPGEIQVRGAW